MRLAYLQTVQALACAPPVTANPGWICGMSLEK